VGEGAVVVLVAASRPAEWNETTNAADCAKWLGLHPLQRLLDLDRLNLAFCVEQGTLRSRPQRYPPSPPSPRITRWHGTTSAIRLAAQADATARVASGAQWLWPLRNKIERCRLVSYQPRP
jgi:hypothetical protein